MNRWVRQFAAGFALVTSLAGAEANAAQQTTNLLFDASNVRQLPADALPKIVSLTPAEGQMEVDPGLKEVVVVFDRDMQPGFSWTGGGPEFPGDTNGRPVWKDARTCTMPVKLEPGRFYRFGINSASHQNFRATNGMPVRPRASYFVTKGASEEVKARARRPKVVAMNPPNGAAGVDPNVEEIRVTFDIPMGAGFSFTGAGSSQYPEARDGQRPRWSEDQKTAILPVRLKPGTEYRLGINSPTRSNFQSTNGVPVEPLIYSFKTRP
jgi:hypothetical protein